MFKNQFYCQSCLSIAVIENDYCSGTCLKCGTQFIRHGCEINGLAGIPQDLWLQAATAVSSIACPSCGRVARVAQTMQQLPGLSDDAKSLWGMVAGGAIAVGVLIFLDGIFSSARRA